MLPPRGVLMCACVRSHSGQSESNQMANLEQGVFLFGGDEIALFETVQAGVRNVHENVFEGFDLLQLCLGVVDDDVVVG